jgi:surface protein
MIQMFYQASNFNQDLSNWNVSGVTDMNFMLDNTAISVANYNSILTGWTGWDGTGATKTLQSGVTFGAVGLNYTSGSTAQDAHDYLVNTLTWSITDAGPI